MVNAMGQMFNAFKEQTPLVVLLLPHRPDRAAPGATASRRSPNQEQIVQPITKYTWLARRAGHDPGDACAAPSRRRGRRRTARPTSPGTPTTTTSGCAPRSSPQDQVDPRMRVRPNPEEVRARRQAAGRGQDAAADRRRRDLQGEGGRQGGEARRAARHAGDAGAPALRQLPEAPSALGRQPAGGNAQLAALIRRTPTSSSTSATSSSTTARRRSCRAGRSSSTCGSTARAWAT